MPTTQETNLDKRIKRQIIGKPQDFLVYTPMGFEQTFVREIAAFGIGVKNEDNQEQNAFTVTEGKVYFTDKLSNALKVLAYSRIAGRFVMKVESFKATNFNQLEKNLEQIPWELYIGSAGHIFKNDRAENLICKPLKISVTCKRSRLYHSDAVKEIFEKVLGNNNSTETLVVDFEDDRCTIGLDLSDAEMYKRGFERFVERAPLKEHLAFAALYEAGISTASAIIDPMAGSGTFSLEAYMYGAGLVPGKMRHFDYEKAPFFKKAAWDYLVSHGVETHNGESAEAMPCKKLEIFASDILPKAEETIRHNFNALANAAQPKNILYKAVLDPIGVSPLQGDSKIVLSKAISIQGDRLITAPLTSNKSCYNHAAPQPCIALTDFFNLDFSKIPDNSILALNPPYGIRLKVDEVALYKRIGEKLNRELGALPSKNLSLVIFIPSKECLEALNIRYDKKIRTNHGGINLDVVFKQW